MAILRTQAGDILYHSEDVKNTTSIVTILQRYKNLKAKGNFKPSQDVRKVVCHKEVIAGIYVRDSARKENTDGDEETEAESLISRIVNAAHIAKASDIHIESRVTHAHVYLRVNGARQLAMEITHADAYAIGNSMYTVHCDSGSKEMSWNPDDVQDGAFTWKTDSRQQYQFRFSSSPIYPQGGFQIVLRMISTETSSALPLAACGYNEHMIDQIDVMTSASSGLVLLCGATNSGKSTSMQAILRLIYEKRGALMKIISVEDPVEYIIANACQISVPRRRSDASLDPNNTPFTRFLRGTLRQDPDIVMVGEIRDNASASIVKDSVLAGRKLISTIHTYSTFGAFLRLREIGVPWEILTMPGFISGLIYQRLVPTLCPHCSIHIKDDMANSEKAGDKKYSKTFIRRLRHVCDIDENDVRVHGHGCDHCKNTGVAGRTICAEFNMPSRMVLELLSQNKLLEAEKQWAEEGGRTALEHAIDKMKDGILSPFKIEENISLLVEGMV